MSDSDQAFAELAVIVDFLGRNADRLRTATEKMGR